MEDDCLYVVRADDLPENPYLGTNVGIITIGMPPAAFSRRRCSFIAIAENTDLLKLYSAVVDIYRKYEQWLANLDRLAELNSPLQAYLDVTYPLVQKSITIHDISFKALAAVPAQMSDGKNYMDTIASVSPKWIVQNLKIDSSKHEPYHVSYTFMDIDYHSLIINIFEEEALLALISITTPSHINVRDSWIIVQLAERIKTILFQDRQLMHLQIKSFRRTFEDLLNGISVDPKAIQRRLRRAGFSENDSWIIVFVSFDPDYSFHRPILSIIKQLEKRIPALTSLRFYKDYVLLIDITRTGENADEVIRIISEILPSKYCLAGYSDRFSNLLDSKLYYQEAQIALEYGKRFTNSTFVYPFENAVREYLLHYGTSDLPARLLCSKGVLSLYKSDQDGGNYLCETLMVYLKNHMNITKSAKDLNIHRSTLLYRLDKIRIYLDIDTKDFTELLYIQQSLALCMEPRFTLS